MRLVPLALVAFLAVAAANRLAPAQVVPEVPAASEAVTKALAAEWLTDDERKDLRIFHGVWDARDVDTPRRAALAALLTWSLDDPALTDPSVPAAWRALALLRRSRFSEALGLLAKDASPEAVALRCETLDWLGRNDDALAAARSLDPLLDEGRATRPQDIVAAARAAMVRGRLEPRSSADWQRILNALGRARNEFDRLHWPALLAEGELLAEKHDIAAAIPVLQQVLMLQPRSSEAWYRLGLLSADQFDFDGADRAVAALERLRPGHPLGQVLKAESALRRRDIELAAETLDRLLARGDGPPEAFADRAAAAALRYDYDSAREWIAKLAAEHPLGPFTVGAFLAEARQYDDAASFLAEAIARRPAWSEPHIALGGMETQTGRDDRARAALEEATKLDPFDRRAQFFLFLLNQLAGYARVEGKHFIVRYQPGLDEVVAAMMPEALDAMHEVVAGRFNHEPDRKTIIDLMPDHRSFGVRITGMPQIHTIAACTGPVIAIEVPKEGPSAKHLGTFDWLKVLRHEYTHTVTLSQTRNRIPHWLTEAAAVSMENVPRSYNDCQMLARELRTGGLFDLDSINWGFIRPKRPHDRALAYAQGNWMVAFMNARFGESALVRLLERYFAGDTEAAAMTAALGVPREAFYREFLTWARAQVAAWGLDPHPSMEDLLRERREADPDASAKYHEALQIALERTAQKLAGQIGAPGNPKRDALVGTEWARPMTVPEDIDDVALTAWLEKYPTHPDVLELAMRRKLKETATDEKPAVLATSSAPPDAFMLDLLDRYAVARPVDPFPHRRLAKLYLEADDPRKAIPHLLELDIREEKDNSFATELARRYRAVGEHAKALASSERAVRMNPYDPALRELAAACAVEAGDLQRAERHVQALVLLEPDAPQHRKRLQRIEELRRAP